MLSANSFLVKETQQNSIQQAPLISFNIFILAVLFYQAYMETQA